MTINKALTHTVMANDEAEHSLEDVNVYCKYKKLITPKCWADLML